MKREQIDWTIIRGSLIGVVISITVCGLLVGGSYYFKEAMKKEYARNDAQFKNISRRYLAVDEEERLINNFYPKFIGLYNQGILGKERRLDWIEVIRQSGISIKLPSLSYDIKSQSTFTPGFSINLGRYKLFKSSMSLNMQLLHEGDLFKLFDELNKYAKGIYNVSSCKLNNASSGEIRENAEASNVIASCDLEWFIIKLANGTEIQV